MPLESKKVYRQFDALKALPAGLTPPDNGAWVIMSAEVPTDDERGGDVIRVRGLKVPAGGVPLQAQHLKCAPDGSPTTIGFVRETRDMPIAWKGAMVDAKLGRFEWAPTDLAKKYKQLWPDFIKTVSVGVLVKDAKPLNPKEPFGGYDFTETELFELSIVTVPANPAATVLCHLRDTLGDDLDIDDGEDEFSADDEYEQTIDLLQQIAKSLQTLTSRLDDIEGDLAALADPEKVRSGQKASPPSAADLGTLLAQLTAANNKLTK